MVTKKQIENDVFILVESMRSMNYEIPTSRKVLLLIFKWLSFVYIFQACSILIDFILHKNVWERHDTSDVLIMSVISCGVVTFLWVVSLYNNISLSYCIDEDLRKRSLLFKIILRKVKCYFTFTIGIVLISTVYLLWLGPAWVGILGIVWVVCTFIGGVAFSMSMSRYMTPAVVATLDKIRQIASSGELVPAKQVNDQQP